MNSNSIDPANAEFLRCLSARRHYIAAEGHGRYRRVQLDLYPTDLEIPHHEAARALEDIAVMYAVGKGCFRAGPVYCAVEGIPTASVPAVMSELRRLVEIHGVKRRAVR